MRLPMSPISLDLAFELVERRRPGHALLSAKGKRLGASANVRTTFDLEAAGEGTAMAWSADVELGGMLGRLAPAMRPVAQRQAEKFLDKLERKLESAALVRESIVLFVGQPPRLPGRLGCPEPLARVPPPGAILRGQS